MNRRTVKMVALMVAISFSAGCVSQKVLDHREMKKKQAIDTNVALGLKYMQRGKINFAKEKLDKAIKLDEYSPDANNGMALLMWHLKEYEKAEVYFDVAVEADPMNAEAQNNFGVFLCERGRVLEGVRRFEKALKNPLYRTPASANVNAGLCFMKIKDYKSAEKYYRKALEIKPKYQLALINMVKMAYQNKQYFKARAFVQRYFATGKESAESLLLAIKIEYKLGAKDAVVDYRMRLRGKYPDSDEATQLKKLRLR